MSTEGLINELSQVVEGENGAEEDIVIFTLSTCMWCKRCKYFLNEHKMKYRYIDVDKIDIQDKAKIINYVKEKYQKSISYPFLGCKSGHVKGYNPEKYKELLKS